MGRALVRERLNRGMTSSVGLALPTKQGMILTCPMDGTMQIPGRLGQGAGRGTTTNQRHAVHEFWSETDGREVLDPAEVIEPRHRRSTHALRPLSNGTSSTGHSSP